MPYFTPDEASRTLPLVKRIIADILIVGQEMRDKSIREDTSRDDLQHLTKKLQELFAEIEMIGCFYKDWNFSIGLVDFPALIDGEDVLLCWRSDEEELRYYHRLEEGYAGRKLIPKDYFETS